MYVQNKINRLLFKSGLGWKLKNNIRLKKVLKKIVNKKTLKKQKRQKSKKNTQKTKKTEKYKK